MKVIRKLEKPILKKTVTTGLTQKLEPEAQIIEAPKPVTEVQQKLENNKKPEYTPNYRYSPMFERLEVKSIENSGWDVSDIWRDIRVDNYCDGW
ncbi:MAG: hypothetical protein KME32_30700 [Mojavia pulchra JT2-VF2]|jgi:hypothetical protein|uniref:Uncharacterized protein n=1 Tax=Mojavia pulchra JT2-VF2 TaxID=287848 RepID=A0A951Q672_9NOST|nr:hypothetical protein [Mojavia pulchra JT2-VF2]